MADKSQIEWTEATWNPIAGCSVVSPGCTNCYAMRRVAPRLSANPATPHYAGTVQASKAGPVWTGKIGIAADSVLLKPLRWRRPRMIFVNSTSDLFHESVPDDVIDRIFAVMALCPQHTFQVLTKRAKRMRDYLDESDWKVASEKAARQLAVAMEADADIWQTRAYEASALGPLPNVWLGVSVEDQTRADERIPELLATPAAVRFISAEPLLGPIHLSKLPVSSEVVCNALTGACTLFPGEEDEQEYVQSHRLDWVIVGGESGDGARPMHPDWARSLRDQCAAAGLPFFFKQWGEWAPSTPEAAAGNPRSGWRSLQGHPHVPRASELYPSAGAAFVAAVGKHAAGRLLDGVEHNGMPGVRA